MGKLPIKEDPLNASEKKDPLESHIQLDSQHYNEFWLHLVASRRKVLWCALHFGEVNKKGEMLAEGGVSLISTRNCICFITIVMLDSRRVPYFGAFNRFQFYTQTLVLVKICTPGDSSRDLFIPKRWRSPTTSKRVTFSPSQKGHQQNSQAHFNFLFITPIGSMYGIFIYIWLIFMVFM